MNQKTTFPTPIVDAAWAHNRGASTLLDLARALEQCLGECREALECADVAMCAVAVPHDGERKVLQEGVEIVRKALANTTFPAASDVAPNSPQTPQAGSKKGGGDPTPGPYYPVQNTAGMWEVKIDNGMYAQSVATISLGCPEYFDGDPEANARLLATSPKLLNALQIMLALSECADETGYVEGEGFVDLDNVYEFVRDIISEATGKVEP